MFDVRRRSQQLKPGHFCAAECSVKDLHRHHETYRSREYSYASETVSDIVMFDAKQLPLHDVVVETEIADALDRGPGIVVFRNAFEADLIDEVSEAFNSIIKSQGQQQADHFGKAGSNSRIWNALEKLAVEHPELFVKYYSNQALATASRAWLGPGYQVTSQVNVVHPGGAAQAMHRDYHLGFQTDTVAAQYPVHAHRICPMLTLQGAIAHVDMPLESGPTLFLPHSHKYQAGYMAWRRPDFQADFAKRCVQLPLAKGDAVFFNPAVFHAAGNNNSSDIHRMANLVQVSSAFGRAMETVDRARIVSAIYPRLMEAIAMPGWSENLTQNVIASSAEGYPFPTNLDFDPPTDGLAPLSQADLVARCVDEMLNTAQMQDTLEQLKDRQASH